LVGEEYVERLVRDSIASKNERMLVDGRRGAGRAER